jgi:hypothetical protein
MALRVQLLGLVGSGKSYLAALLARNTAGVQLAFAKEVYRLATLVKGGPVDKTLYDDRQILKSIGTLWGRESRSLGNAMDAVLAPNRPPFWGSKDVWARSFVQNCRSLPDEVSIFNDDTRFANELRITVEEEGFLPVFVLCREATRMARLSMRGERFDPNDISHKSEVLVNALKDQALEEAFLPVVWNDDLEGMPPEPWVMHHEKFVSEVSKMTSQQELMQFFLWDQQRAANLIEYTSRFE